MYDLQSNRRQGKALDLPVLPAEEPLPPALQGHFGDQPPSGATAKIHHNRVYPLSTGTNSPSVHLRGGHLCRRGRAQGAQGDARRQLELAPAQCPRRSHHLRHHGESTLASEQRWRRAECHIGHGTRARVWRVS